MQSLLEGVLSMLNDHNVTYCCLCEGREHLVQQCKANKLSSKLNYWSIKCISVILYWNYIITSCYLKKPFAAKHIIVTVALNCCLYKFSLAASLWGGERVSVFIYCQALSPLDGRI